MIRVGTDAGLSIADVFRQQSRRGPPQVRQLSGRVAERLGAGESLSKALEPETGRLPRLFIALCEVGEETGHLGETFRELEDYFETQHTLRKQFQTQIAWPMFEFIAAIFVISLMLLVMGWLGIQADPIGVGVGAMGAIKFLLIVGTVVGVMLFAYLAISRQIRFMAPVERVILSLPMVGPALESVLLGRFCLGLRMTMGAGLNVSRSVQHSLDATASALFLQSYIKAKPELKRGSDLVTVLERCRVFPREFLDVVANAEESGQVPEVMERQGRYYREEASRRLKTLAQFAGYAVYAGVALMIIYLIFTIYGGHIASLNSAVNEIHRR